MPRELNDLMDRLDNGQDLLLTADGQVVDPAEPHESQGVSTQQSAGAQKGVLLKNERFGA